LPAGLSLNGATGFLTGTPLIGGVGTTYFTLRGTKSGATLDIPVSIQILQSIASIAASITIPPALRSMTVGVAVSAALVFTASFGIAPISWSISSGALPAGLVMDSRGNVSGVPTAVTPTTYTQPTITLTDRNGATRNFTPSGSNTFAVSAPI